MSVLRRVGIVVVVVAAVVLAVVGWTWLRPVWQTNSLASDLRSIDGVASVAEPRDDDQTRTFRVVLDDDAQPEALVAAASEVRTTVDGREVGGHEVTAEVRASGFVLDDAMRAPLSENLLRSVVALRDVEGLSRVRANDTFIDVTAPPDELLPQAVEALQTLGSEGASSRATLRVQAKDQGPTVSASIAGAKDEAPVLKRFAAVAQGTGVRLTTGGDLGAGLRLFAEGDELECSAKVLLDEPRRLRQVADAFAEVGGQCRTDITTADDKRLVTVASGPDGVDKAFDLLARAEKIGLSSVGVSTDLQSLSGSVTDGDELLALRDLTESDDWPLAEAAPLTVTWEDTGWLALKLKKADILQRYGAGMARIRDAGFVASFGDQADDLQNRLTVTDDVDGAPRLVDPEGRTAMVKAIRSSGLPGVVDFYVYNQRNYDGVTFASTAGGAATDIRLPEKGVGSDVPSPTAWAEDFMALWSSTARG